MDKEFSEFYIGTAADVSSAGVKILFDGQAAATEKRYKILNTGVQVAADDRVIVAKISGSYVVLGKIAYTQSGGGGGDYVEKSGDTMTGDLEMADGKSLLQNASTLVVGTRPSSNLFTNPISFRDKLKTLYAKLQGIFLTDGRVGLQLLAARTVSGTNYENRIGLYIDETGASSVVVTAADAWRTALGLGAAATRAVATSPASGSTSLITSGGVYTAITDLVIGASAAFAIPASGSSVSKNMSGLTANHVLVAWNFSASAENLPPADLTCTTYSGYFTITNNNGTTSETIKPVFALPKAVTLSNH